jgi:hypothetical protein
MITFRFFVFLGLALTCFTSVVRAAQPFRLFEIAVTRFSPLPDGRAQLEYGLLDALDQFRVTETFNVMMPSNMPAAALGKALVSSEAWFAFGSLGPQALANFERVNNGLPHVIASIPHYEVAAAESAIFTVGNVVNLSTRGRVAAGTTPSLIGGFVIDGQARRVLIRAIGPELATFNVTDVLPDPFLTIRKGALAIHFNGDWGTRPDANEIAEVSAAVGAFPLRAGSKDAVLLVELPAGAYTASVESETGGAGGEALLEIYVLP